MMNTDDRLITLVRERAADIMWRSDLTWPRLAVAIASLVYAFILLALGPQFDRPSYVHMRFAPQWAWGLTFAGVGILQLSRAIAGVSVVSRFSQFAAMLIFWMWAGVTIAIMSSQRPPPAMSACVLTVALLSAVILVRSFGKRA